MIAVGSLLLLVALSLLVNRVATVVLTATGLPRHVARFQARSALTGAGFTTSESEGVVNHPIRRRVIGTLMLLGSAGLVGAASAAILGFRGGAVGRVGWRLTELVGGLLVIVFVSRSRWIDRRLTATVGHALRRYTDIPARDLSGLLQLSGDYGVQELLIAPDDWVAGRTLAEVDLRAEGIAVLAVTHADGTFIGAPDGDTMLRPGDNLVLYSHAAQLKELDGRLAGTAGDEAHAAAVRRRASERGDRPGGAV